MATISNLFIDQGSDFSAIITLKNQDGSTLNLTGFTVASQFRKSYQSSSATNFTVTVYDAFTIAGQAVFNSSHIVAVQYQQIPDGAY